jgi:hypothetical protein
MNLLWISIIPLPKHRMNTIGDVLDHTHLDYFLCSFGRMDLPWPLYHTHRHANHKLTWSQIASSISRDTLPVRNVCFVHYRF